MSAARRCWPGVALAAGLHAAPALAVLGGAVNALPAAGPAAAAPAPVRSVRLAAAATHSVHETVLPDGSRFSEYANAQGRVFMVSWSMHYKPRLDGLLGPYQAHYQSALLQRASQPGAARAVDLAHGPLRARASGYLGRFTGSAWLPQDLPAGFDAAATR